MSRSEAETERVEINVFRDRLTGGYQLSIDKVKPDGGGHGYRIFGPKFRGDSERLGGCVLDKRIAAEIRRYLDDLPDA